MLDERLDCPIARECGGCSEIGKSYGEQLRSKRDRVRATLARQPELAGIAVEPCRGAPLRSAYRNRAKLAVRQTPDGVRIGLHRRGSSELVDLAPCRVQRPVLQRGIEELRGWLGEEQLARPEGPVFYVDLRETVQQGCHLTLVLDRAVEAADLPLERLAERWPALAGVAVNIGNPRSSYPLGPDSSVVRGAPRFLAPLGTSESSPAFEVPPAGFFQVAPAALEEVHEAMAVHLAGAGELLDLYCGVGVHGIVVARRLGRECSLIGVEESSALVEAARRNAELHSVANVRYLPGRVEERLDELPVDRSSGVIVNPGRAGCHAAVVEWIGKAVISRLAYLSCNADTLARDLAQLVRAGFAVKSLHPVDLMPQTEQVEVLALVDR